MKHDHAKMIRHAMIIAKHLAAGGHVHLTHRKHFEGGGDSGGHDNSSPEPTPAPAPTPAGPTGLDPVTMKGAPLDFAHLNLPASFTQGFVPSPANNVAMPPMMSRGYESLPAPVYGGMASPNSGGMPSFNPMSYFMPEQAPLAQGPRTFARGGYADGGETDPMVDQDQGAVNAALGVAREAAPDRPFGPAVGPDDVQPTKVPLNLGNVANRLDTTFKERARDFGQGLAEFPSQAYEYMKAPMQALRGETQKAVDQNTGKIIDVLPSGMSIDEAAMGGAGLVSAGTLPDIMAGKITPNMLRAGSIESKIGNALKEQKYATEQAGPFYRVYSPETSEARFVPEGNGKAFWPSSPNDVRGRGQTSYGTSQLDPITGKKSPLMPDAENNIPLQAANKYVEKLGLSPVYQPDMPPSSLAKQSAIGRTFMLAAEDLPEYKEAIFNAYKQQMPEIVEQSGAKNYDELLESSYRQMAKETSDQFDALPLRYSFHRNGEGNYDSSAHMVGDVHNNGHLFVFQGGDTHDFLHNIDPATGLNENEKFRAVHDAFGHALLGNTFNAQGEERAWGVHSQMYSPLARPAMTAETRGQNSVVNYTPLNMKTFDQLGQIEMHLADAIKNNDIEKINALKNEKTEAMKDWQYAPQVSVLLPPEFLKTDYAGGMPDYVRNLVKPQENTGFSSTLAHFSRSPNINVLDPTFYGTGLSGGERDRLFSKPGGVTDRVYAYLGDPNRVKPEPGLGSNKYKGQAENLYDWNKDPAGLWAISQELNRAPATAKVNPAFIDMQQAQNDMERLVKEYGYSGIANPKHRYPMAVMFDPLTVQKVRKSGGRTNIVDGALSVSRQFGPVAAQDAVNVAKQLTRGRP